MALDMIRSFICHSMDVKNELSHRGKALRAIKEQLRKYCEEGAYEDTDRQ